jgi:hypothetical protein
LVSRSGLSGLVRSGHGLVWSVWSGLVCLACLVLSVWAVRLLSGLVSSAGLSGLAGLTGLAGPCSDWSDWSAILWLVCRTGLHGLSGLFCHDQSMVSPDTWSRLVLGLPVPGLFGLGSVQSSDLYARCGASDLESVMVCSCLVRLPRGGWSGVSVWSLDLPRLYGLSTLSCNCQSGQSGYLQAGLVYLACLDLSAWPVHVCTCHGLIWSDLV